MFTMSTVKSTWINNYELYSEYTAKAPKFGPHVNFECFSNELASRDGSAKQMQCTILRKNVVTVVQCNANFDSIFTSHLHFALFCSFFWCIFCAFLLHFSQFFGALTMKYQPKGRKKCKNAKKMQKVDANVMQK